MIDKNDVAKKLLSIISDVLDYEEEIHPEDSLVDEYGINSLESLRLMVKIEDTWGIEMTGEMLFHIDTVQDMIDAICEQLQ